MTLKIKEFEKNYIEGLNVIYINSLISVFKENPDKLTDGGKNLLINYFLKELNGGGK